MLIRFAAMAVVSCSLLPPTASGGLVPKALQAMANGAGLGMAGQLSGCCIAATSHPASLDGEALPPCPPLYGNAISRTRTRVFDVTGKGTTPGTADALHVIVEAIGPAAAAENPTPTVSADATVRPVFIAVGNHALLNNVRDSAGNGFAPSPNVGSVSASF